VFYIIVIYGCLCRKKIKKSCENICVYQNFFYIILMYTKIDIKTLTNFNVKILAQFKYFSYLCSTNLKEVLTQLNFTIMKKVGKTIVVLSVVTLVVAVSVASVGVTSLAMGGVAYGTALINNK